MERSDICGNCDFWDKNRRMSKEEFANRIPTSILWKCRRYAPGNTDGKKLTVVGNTKTEFNYGCGEFKPDSRIKKKRAAKPAKKSKAETKIPDTRTPNYAKP